MTGIQNTPFTLPLFLVALVSAGLAFTVWRRRPGAGVIPFVVLMLALTQWSLGNMLELAVSSLQLKTFFANFQFIGITTVPAAWLAFTLEYTGRGKWLTRRNIALLTIMPVITVVVALTNVADLFRTSVFPITRGEYTLLGTVMGPGYWVHAAYSYFLLVAGAGLLIQSFIRSSRLYRRQTAALLVASFVPWLANFLTIFDLNPLAPLDLTPFAFTITGLAMGWSIVRFRLLDIVPVARDTIIENMRDAVLVLDAQNRVVDINPAAIRAIGIPSASAIIGKPAVQVLSGYQDLVEKYRTVEEARAEITLREHEPTRRDYELHISPLRNRHGDLTARLIVLHDISDIKRAAAQIGTQNEELARANRGLVEAQMKAEEASRLKSEFLATMSHELRTPLNSVIGYADFMLTGLPGKLSERQEDYLKRIMSNGERLLALINDILDISKIEAARLELTREPFSPMELLEGIQSRMQSLADQKGLYFATHLDPNLPPQLKGDVRRLEQILANLIDNAIRFTEVGRVDVHLEKANDSSWTMSVLDTGMGIPPHALEFIFDEFRQVDGSPQREKGGTGLGLAIVRKLTTLMGGWVRVQSEVGKGSTFTVQVPMQISEAPVIEARQQL
jgi:PAS domain S-box-containing protein